jgi:hypothetical protein
MQLQLQRKPDRAVTKLFWAKFIESKVVYGVTAFDGDNVAISNNVAIR